jgi:hypothetical protein
MSSLKNELPSSQIFWKANIADQGFPTGNQLTNDIYSKLIYLSMPFYQKH